MVQRQRPATKTPRTVVLILGSGLFAGVALGAWWYSSGKTSPSVTPSPASGMTCDMGVSAAKAGRGSVAPVTVQPVAATVQTAQPVSNSPGTKVQPPPGPAPEGMAWIPGGEFWMGADEFPDARPWHR
ncbi:MAG TPA: hypothetical protein VLS44_03970, partial [Nitrospira sp.]|nr:hypothetical protein [Nitrospira sp.]